MTREDVYRCLAEKYGWGPETVREMTLAQQLMYFEDNDSGHVKFDSVAEAKAYQRSRQ